MSGRVEPVLSKDKSVLLVVWPFLAVPWVCLPFVIIVFPNHNNLLFLLKDTTP